MAFIEPLNLEQLLVVNFSGTVEIFVFLMVILISGLAARFRMSNGIALPIFALFIVFMFGTSLSGEFTGLYVITVVLTSFFVFWGVSRYFK